MRPSWVFTILLGFSALPLLSGCASLPSRSAVETSPGGKSASAQGAAVVADDLQTAAIAMRSADQITNELWPWLLTGGIVTVSFLIAGAITGKRWVTFLAEMVKNNSYLVQKPKWLYLTEQKTEQKGEAKCH